MRSFEKYPRVLRYLSGLPEGLDAHPTYVQKGALFRQLLQLAPAKWGSDLPAPLDALVRAPPPLNAWISEVQATVVHLAIVDVQGWDDRYFVARSLTLIRELLRGPLYRILMTVTTPTWLVRGAASRWGAVHRGIALSARMSGSTSALFKVTFPSRLVPPLLAECFATGFQAALEGASAKKVTSSLVMSTDENAVYRCDWS